MKGKAGRQLLLSGLGIALVLLSSCQEEFKQKLFQVEKTITYKENGREFKAVEKKALGKLPCFLYSYQVKDKKKKYVLKGNLIRCGNEFFVFGYKYNPLTKKLSFDPTFRTQTESLPFRAPYLQKAWEVLKEKGLAFSVGKGDKVIYLVFDGLCPFCAQKFSSFPLLQKKYKGYQFRFVPLAVHGQDSLTVNGMILEKAKKEGILKSLSSVYSKLAKVKNKEEYLKLLKELKNYKVSGETLKIEEKVAKILMENGVLSTPSIFVEVGGGKFVRK